LIDKILVNVFVFCFGLIWGSFLNVLIYRLPLGIMFRSSRSECPSCRKTILWYENIPVFSYIFLKGRCSSCKTQISLRYPIVEIITGFLALFAFRDLSNLDLLPYLFLNFSILCIFLVLFCIDIDHKLLPDVLTGYLALCFLFLGIMSYSWTHWLIGGLIGFCFPLVVTWIFYKIKGQVGLGGGDIKLFGALGLYLGPIGIIHNIFLSCFVGSIYGVILIASGRMEKTQSLPFGPFIILVATFQIFFSDLYHRLIFFLLN
jgi:leader peptidase (prepilin peptidase)/N-methyltransferase